MKNYAPQHALLFYIIPYQLIEIFLILFGITLYSISLLWTDI